MAHDSFQSFRLVGRTILISIVIVVVSVMADEPLTTTDSLLNETFNATTIHTTTDSPYTVYTNFVAMDEDGNYRLFWAFTDTEITFEIRAKTHGYVGLGFSTTGGMTNADIVIGWVKDGVGYLSDRFATSHGEPSIDESQDYTLLAAKETQSQTILTFSRNFRTCDHRDLDIQESVMSIIWAYHPDDPDDPDNLVTMTGLAYHGTERRGKRNIYLLDYASLIPDVSIDDPGIKIMELRNPNISMHWHAEDTYRCEVIKLPSLGGKHHMVKYEPIIGAESESELTYIKVKQCLSYDIDDAWNGYGYDCYGDVPANLSSCYSVFISWTRGGSAFRFPVEVGFSLDDIVSGDPKFVVMETAFHHGLNSSLIDSSGIRIYYTSNLRQYDAGIMSIGAGTDQSLVIPPRANQFVIKGYCSKECTNYGLYNQSIGIFASLLDGQSLTTAIRTRHLRNGRELKIISQNVDYNIYLKDIKHLKSTIWVEPGDDLVTECTYNTAKKSRITYGGYDSHSEKCTNYLFYYPRTPLMTCKSVPEWRFAIYALAKVTKVDSSEWPYIVLLPEYYAGKTHLQILNGLRWTQELRDELEATYNTAYTNVCVRYGGPPATYGDFSFVPEVRYPLENVDVCGSGAIFAASLWKILTMTTFTLHVIKQWL
ncbi:DBH-like monooxygenase protein 1 [Ptychodera flava]|uniref:DBH-like monooxygenase protein 1 n=1 Tax=Ptychodera flava TaxID=63121 RepID=UPI003969D0A7